jgi:hypothetical protein
VAVVCISRLACMLANASVLQLLTTKVMRLLRSETTL